MRSRGVTCAFLWIMIFAKAEIADRAPTRFQHGNFKNVDVMIQKVSLTQKGYIQFLKYMATAPTINDFTFCIWLKSANFTHSHPLLSYSLNERDRFIRGWITPYGKRANLEIMEHEIFSVPVDLVENQWIHMCQSWEGRTGSWNLFLNGKIKAGGVNQKMQGVQIPSEGDIVVGQEYTDFDKGLDDGIEGDIFGFNMVLTATSSEKQTYVKQNDLSLRRQDPVVYSFETPPHIRNVYKPYSYYEFGKATPEIHPVEELASTTQVADVPEVLSYFTAGVNRNPKGLLDIGRNIFHAFNIFDDGNKDRYYVYHTRPVQNRYAPPRNIYQNKRIFNTNSGVLNEVGVAQKPLGLVLVELSYNNCELGKGSPINNDKLLVSWTKTPVRVFGGAILKNVVPFCAKT